MNHRPVNNITIRETFEGWYVAADSSEGGDCYLHKDGRWLDSATNEFDAKTGYFRTKWDAIAALNDSRPEGEE